MLQMWRTCYMQTRAQIEASGKGQRWEFDKNKLFANSEYIAKVCGDLHEVSKVRKTFVLQQTWYDVNYVLYYM